MKLQGLFLAFFLIGMAACKSDQSKIPVLSNEEILRIDDELYPAEDTNPIIKPEDNTLGIDENLNIKIDSAALSNAPQKSERPNYTAPFIDFTDSVLIFKDVEVDSILNFNFQFTNIGRKPLELKSVEPTCGCTVAENEFLPIKSNEKGAIKGQLNTKGKQGKFSTTVLVHSNAENSPTLLKIQVQLKDKKAIH